MAIRVEPLATPKLYPDDPRQILSWIQNTIYEASNGELNDFSPHAPLTAISEGYLFGALELLYYVNQLPQAAGLSFLKIAGIQRIMGRAATVTLTFTITPIGNDFTLSPGYVVRDNQGREFVTTGRLIIRAGQTTGDVAAIASTVVNGVRVPALGASYNVEAYTLTQLSESRAYLLACTNLEPAEGGTDSEAMSTTLSRGFASLRRVETLVSADDYEQATQTYLGDGSVALAIGRLSDDRVSYKDGTVHIFCLNADKTPPNLAQLSELRAYLGELSPAGLHLVSVSPMLVQDIELYVIAILLPGSNKSEVGQRIYDKLSEYLAPGNLPPGQSILIKELEYVVRSSGVETVQSVSSFILDPVTGGVSVTYADIPLKTLYSTARLYGLELTLVDEELGTEYSLSFGDGGDKD